MTGIAGIKLIIAGSRGITDYALVRGELDKFWRENIPTEIAEVVSGTANGADRLGERWAIETSIPIKRFPADWDNLGKSAGYKRNEQMAQYADEAIVFWDGTSKGTQHMIDIMAEHKKPCQVIIMKTKTEVI